MPLTNTRRRSVIPSRSEDVTQRQDDAAPVQGLIRLAKRRRRENAVRSVEAVVVEQILHIDCGDHEAEDAPRYAQVDAKQRSLSSEVPRDDRVAILRARIEQAVRRVDRVLIS